MLSKARASLYIFALLTDSELEGAPLRPAVLGLDRGGLGPELEQPPGLQTVVLGVGLRLELEE